MGHRRIHAGGHNGREGIAGSAGFAHVVRKLRRNLGLRHPGTEVLKNPCKCLVSDALRAAKKHQLLRCFHLPKINQHVVCGNQALGALPRKLLVLPEIHRIPLERDARCAVLRQKLRRQCGVRGPGDVADFTVLRLRPGLNQKTEVRKKIRAAVRKKQQLTGIVFVPAQITDIGHVLHNHRIYRKVRKNRQCTFPSLHNNSPVIAFDASLRRRAPCGRLYRREAYCPFARSSRIIVITSIASA